MKDIIEYKKAAKIGGVVLDGYEKGPPCCSIIWCSPCFAKCCSCCTCCFSKCSQCSACSPCCYFNFPCCCCCCRPPVKLKPSLNVDFESTVAESIDSEREVLQKKKETPRSAKKDASPAAKSPRVPKSTPKQTEEKKVTIAKQPEEIKSPTPPETPNKTTVVKKKREAVRPKPAVATKPKAFADSASAAPIRPEEAQGPPPPPPFKSKKTGAGVYLIYRDEEGGELFHKWSTDVVEGPGVLAYIKSSIDIPSFRFKKEGISVVAKNLVKNFLSSYPQDRVSYYNEWAKFLHISVDVKGEIILLPSSSVHPPPQVSVIFLKSHKVTFAKVDTSYNYKDIDVLGVVPTASAPKFQANDIDFTVFSLIANTDGSCTSFTKK